ncbi:TetR family transcriptional regulator C-terminal domain-containing protein [Nostoc sp. NIES-2111]
MVDTVLKGSLNGPLAGGNRWIAEGKIAPVEPAYLFYMIWASTQHYADFARQIEVLNGGPLSDEQFEAAKRQVVDTILRGILAA